MIVDARKTLRHVIWCGAIALACPYAILAEPGGVEQAPPSNVPLGSICLRRVPGREFYSRACRSTEPI